MNILFCYEFHKQGEDYSRGYDIYSVSNVHIARAPYGIYCHRKYSIRSLAHYVTYIIIIVHLLLNHHHHYLQPENVTSYSYRPVYLYFM
jgi:hypothetical protein